MGRIWEGCTLIANKQETFVLCIKHQPRCDELESKCDEITAFFCVNTGNWDIVLRLLTWMTSTGENTTVLHLQPPVSTEYLWFIHIIFLRVA